MKGRREEEGGKSDERKGGGGRVVMRVIGKLIRCFEGPFLLLSGL